MPQVRLSRILAVGCAVVLLSTGCGVIEKPPGSAESEPKSDSPKTSQAESSAGEPSTKAADSGGICKYLDFSVVNKATSKQFSIAESGGQDEVTSCVLQTTAGSFPDITLTMAKTGTDEKTYRNEIPPKGAKSVKDLGKAGYSVLRDKVKKGGPVVELGWLTKGHLYSLRYTADADTSKDDAKATVDPLVDAVRDIAKAAAEDEKKED